VMSPGTVLRPPLMELKSITRTDSVAATRTLGAAQRDHILEVLDQTRWLIGGNEGAAARLGLPRTTLIYKMRKLGIETRRPHRREFLGEPSFAAATAF
jgi:transcriptional regulator with GAF, ATPase, and Fis domain